MSAHAVDPSVEPAHTQVAPDIAPSGSARAAVSAAPTIGGAGDRVTAPASSTLVTLMVTVMVSVASDVSVAVTVTV